MLSLAGVSSRLGRRSIHLRAMLPLVSDEAPKKWIQVALAKRFEGHPSGAFEFNGEVFDNIIANFNALENKTVPLTYEHPARLFDGPIKAAGWIHELKHDGDSMWALVEFTPDAAEMVRKGEYRFCSVVVVFDSEHRVTKEPIGAELIEIGLTNTPFIDGLQPITLSRKGTFSMTFSELLKKAMKELPEDVSPEKGMQYLGLLVQGQSALEGAAETLGEEGGDAPDAELSREVKASATTLDAAPAAASDVKLEDAPAEESASPESEAEALLMEITGLDLAAALELLKTRKEELQAFLSGAPGGAPSAAPLSRSEITEAVKATRAAFSKQLAERDAEAKQLSARIETLEQEKTERIVDDAVNAGHILATDKPKFLALSKKAPDLFIEFLGEAKQNPAVPTGQLTKDKPEAKEVKLSADQFPAEVLAQFRASRGSNPRYTKEEAERLALQDAQDFMQRKR